MKICNFWLTPFGESGAQLGKLSLLLRALVG
jgi:hypothetical protein